MEKQKVIFKTMDEYLRPLPQYQRERMEIIRSIVRRLVPEAQEVISYNMPAFWYHGMLCFMAAHTRHIGFYPAGGSAIERFREELKPFATSKGTVQFRNDREMPVALIEKIILFRAEENRMKAQAKRKTTAP